MDYVQIQQKFYPTDFQTTFDICCKTSFMVVTSNFKRVSHKNPDLTWVESEFRM